MRLILGLGFFGLISVLILWKSAGAIDSWLLLSDPDQITFEDGDTKLAFLWTVILAAIVSYFVWPQSFQPNPQISWKQAAIIGAGASGILGGIQALTGGNYLGAAEQHGLAHGYTLCANGSRLVFGELTMAKSAQLCGDDETA
ncbi:MAG: hypothetical protein AAF692_01395 [Pseudomonadota bacterium]